MIKEYCIGNVCKPLSVWSKLFDINVSTLRGRLARGLSLIEAICFVPNKKECNHSRKNVKSKEYQSWRSMIIRCYYPKNISYKNYGAKGITVCDKWRYSFKAFLDYIGPKPKGEKTTLDRIDPKGNYEPGNVRWATTKVQNINRGILKNNKSGYTGVRWLKQNKKWSATISLGCFNTKEEALAARLKAEEIFYKPLLNEALLSSEMEA